jgi:hypothetical protein
MTDTLWNHHPDSVLSSRMPVEAADNEGPPEADRPQYGGQNASPFVRDENRKEEAAADHPTTPDTNLVAADSGKLRILLLTR